MQVRLERAVLLVLMGAVTLRADLYSTGFEAPAFTTGPIAGQDGWGVFGPGNSAVQNFFAKTGSQAVFIDGSTPSQSGPFHSDTSTGPLIELSADIAIFTSSTQSSWQFAGIGPGLIGYLGGINVGSDNTIYAITPGVYGYWILPQSHRI